MNENRRIYNLKSVIVGGILTIGGLILIILSVYIDQNNNPIIYGLVTSVSSTLLVGGFLGLSYEFFLRKELLNEFDNSTKMLITETVNIQQRIEQHIFLATSLRDIGFIKVSPRESHFDYSDIIINSKKLYFVFNDGRTWFSRHQEDIHLRSKQVGFETHVILAHPNSIFLSSLSIKVDQAAEELTRKINETIKLISRMPWVNHDIKIYGHFLPTSYSLVMSEENAIFIPYPMARKADRLPCFTFSSKADEGFHGLLWRDVQELINHPHTENLFPRKLL